MNWLCAAVVIAHILFYLFFISFHNISSFIALIIFEHWQHIYKNVKCHEQHQSKYDVRPACQYVVTMNLRKNQHMRQQQKKTAKWRTKWTNTWASSQTVAARAITNVLSASTRLHKPYIIIIITIIIVLNRTISVTVWQQQHTRSNNDNNNNNAHTINPAKSQQLYRKSIYTHISSSHAHIQLTSIRDTQPTLHAHIQQI